MITQPVFDTPAIYEMGVKTGSILRIGGLLKHAASGRIVAHLQESGLAHSLVGNAMLGMTSPATLGVSVISQLVNAGSSIYTAGEVEQLKTMIEGFQSLQVATLGVSLLGVGVSVGGFLYMHKRFNAVDKSIDKLLDAEIEGFKTQKKSHLRAHLSQVNELVQQAIEAPALTNPGGEYARIADGLAAEAAYFEGELDLLVKIRGKVPHEFFWQLAQALMVCNSARIDCWVRANELANARAVASDVAESYQRLFGNLNPLSFDIQPTQGEKTVTVLKDITDVAATKPYLMDYLHSQRIDGPGYLERIEREKSHPLLMLKVA